MSRRGLGLAAIGVVPGSGFGWQPARAEAAEAAAAAADVDKAWKAAAPRVAYSDFMQLVLSDRVAEVRYDTYTNRTVSLKLMLKQPTADYRPLAAAARQPFASAFSRSKKSDSSDEPEAVALVSVLAVDVPPGDNALLATLQARGVTIVAAPADTDVVTALDLVLQVLLLGLLVFALTGGLGGGQGVGGLLTKKFSVYEKGQANEVFFDDVAGLAEAKEDLAEVVEFLSEPERFLALGARVPKGVLLTGPPGTGKTLLARAAAGEAGVPFISISGSEFVELFVGLGARRVRALFAKARALAPCVIFIDEIDAIGKQRSTGGGGVAGVANEEREQTLNQLLTEMDGFNSDPRLPVVVLAATNRVEVLDAALLRPGRLDRTVAVGVPDRQGRRDILQIHLNGKTVDALLDIDAVLAATVGLTGAQLANVANEAALLAARRRLPAITTAELVDATERVVAGAPRRSARARDKEQRTVAVHECGHAILGVVTSAITDGDTVTKVSIVPRVSGALGFTLKTPPEDRYLATSSDIRGSIAVLLAGRAAERLVFDEVTTGAADDLQRAPRLAEQMVGVWGMSAAVGPRALLPAESAGSGAASAIAMGRPGASSRLPSMEQGDHEVSVVLRAAAAQADEVLAKNRELLDEMAEELLRAEVLDGPVLRNFLARAVVPKEFSAWLKS